MKELKPDSATGWVESTSSPIGSYQNLERVKNG